MDLRVGRALAPELQILGLDAVDLSVNVPTVRGGKGLGACTGLSVLALAERYLSAGLLTDAEIGEIAGSFDDPNLVAAGMADMSAWGQRPRAQI